MLALAGAVALHQRRLDGDHRVQAGDQIGHGDSGLLRPAAGQVVAFAGSGLHWVIVGGESGQKARPMHTDWARALRDDCDAADIAFFFKQVGAWSPEPTKGKASIGLMPDGQVVDLTTAGALMLWEVGAKRAGELLDGQLRQAFPT